MKESELKYYKKKVILPFIIFIILFLIPLLFTLSKAFFINGSFDLSGIKKVFTSSYTYSIFSFTFKQAIVSTIFSVLLALPGAYLFSNYAFKFKRFFLSLAALCFILPSILVVLGFVIFYGNYGFLNTILMNVFGFSEPPLKILYSFKAIILAHTFLNFPIALVLITNTWSTLSPDLENSALLLKDNRISIFFKITLKRIMPSILSASLLIFLFCFTSFSIILVLGGGPQFTTLEIEIYQNARTTLNQNAASAYSIFSLVCNLILVTVFITVSRNYQNKEKKIQRDTKKAKGFVKVLLIIYLVLILIFILSPMLSILYRSFISSSAKEGTGFSLRQYKIVLETGLNPILNSLTIALIASFISVTLARPLSLFISKKKSKIYEILLLLPMAISSVTLGLGYYYLADIAINNTILSFISIIGVHIVITLPFALRSLTPIATSIDKNLSLSGLLLKDSPKGVMKNIEYPLLKNGTISAFMFAFAISFGEVNASLVLSGGKIVTLPMQLYRLIGSYNYQGACALGTIHILITLIVFLMATNISKEKKWHI